MPPTVTVTARDALLTVSAMIERFLANEKRPPQSDLTLSLIDQLVASFSWADSLHGQAYWNNVRLALAEEAKSFRRLEAEGKGSPIISDHLESVLNIAEQAKQDKKLQAHLDKYKVKS